MAPLTEAPLRNTDAIRVGRGGNSPLKRMLDHADHYQSLLGDLIRIEKPFVMIESGVESGYSTEHFLVAMDDAKCGHLYSCDPAPSGFYEANPIVHPRFTFIKEASYTALDKIAKMAGGPIDVFLHDSDHSFRCQFWEYSWAWDHVRSGGIIASDDTKWSDTPGRPDIEHGAWDKFVSSHGLKDVVINNARWVRRP